ncbi:hypothetical protein ZWY2020_047850 [Hordeum vulgare]|nr:hypothetical protein ZWY2020_047850 [Hordeum vulgare]
MGNGGLNNVPAAGEQGADAAVASEGGELQSPPPSSGYYASSEGSDGYLTGAEEGESSRAVPALPQPPAPAAAAVWPLAFGSASQKGQDDDEKMMEDTVSLRPFFCAWVDGSPMHFFAVFDGHGGPRVSALCRDQMHAILAEELAVAATAYRKEHPEKDEEAERRAWEAALKRSFERADALGMGLSESGWPVVGSTAVVALVVGGSILVANCGDSRAVLCRAGHAIPLSEDHKLERADERARVKAAGGKVWRSSDEQLRVGGLAMSRALGHRLLKPAVICEPDITMTTRSEDDDCMILASDGLWDVIENQKACNVASNCLEIEHQGAPGGGAPIGQEEEVGCVHAASHLMNMAIHGKSPDDISVVVLDLKARG